MSRRNREPTNQQISSRLSYQQETPSFLRKLQNKIAGNTDDSDDEFEDDGSGRPPIPKRPEIPERLEGDKGSEDEEYGDEKPTVVVLKEGKHLSEWEAQNVRRAERGLAPLPDPQTTKTPEQERKKPVKEKASEKASLSFSSSKSGAKSSSNLAGKRKAAEELDALEDAARSLMGDTKKSGRGAKKKAKKENKYLLSFGDDA